MNKIRKVYDEISLYNPFCFGTLDFDSFEKSILQKIENALSTTCNITTEKNTTPKLPTSNRYIQYIENAKKTKELYLDSGVILPFFDYIYGYQDLSFEQFVSYVYWRTQIRKKNKCETPTAYLCLYLIELCNFVEFDTVNDTKEMLWYLVENMDDEKNKSVVINAICDFLVLYGTLDDLCMIYVLQDPFTHLKENLLYLNNVTYDSFDFISNKSSYKIKNSKIYNEFPYLFEKHFLACFKDVIGILNKHDIDIIPLCIGKLDYSDYDFSYVIKKINTSLVVEKCFAKQNVILLNVKRDSVQKALRMPQNEEYGPERYVFYNNFWISYLFRLFENEIRKCIGKHQIKVLDKSLEKLLKYKQGNVNCKIFNTYNSAEFFECIAKHMSNFIFDYNSKKRF